MMPLAHIVQGAPVPYALGWVAASLVAVGGAGIFLWRGTALEVVSWVVLGLAFCGVVSVIVLTALLPVSARIGITMVAPPSGDVTSPVDVVVCGRAAGGSPAAAPDGDNVLVVVLDGREVGIEHTGSFAVEASPGRHQLRVELLTRDHRVFNPEVTAEATVTVTGVRAVAEVTGACPRR